MFADRARIFIRSGKGGDGHVSFRRELYVPDGGPDGGDGGKGGDIVFVGDGSLGTLMDFRYKRVFKAEAGEPLTKENLCEAYYQLNKDYYGEAVVHDTEISYEWARIPHFYRSFYVYKYSTDRKSVV